MLIKGLVLTVFLGIATFFLFKSCIANIQDGYQKLAEGNWVINTYQFNRIISSRPFDIWDVRGRYISLILPFISFSSAAITFVLIPSSIYNSYKEVLRENNLG